MSKSKVIFRSIRFGFSSDKTFFLLNYHLNIFNIGRSHVGNARCGNFG